jgi:hypothetical protein
VAEPKVWAYPAPYRAHGSVDENYFAIYGSKEAITALEAVGCTARSRLRVDTENESKAYLQNDLAKQFLSSHSLDMEGKNAERKPLFALSSKPDEPTIAFYHTKNLVRDPAHPDQSDNDTLSYLVLSAKDAKSFEPIASRLTDATRLYARSHHIGRGAGEFLLLPIRRSMTDAIARAHPHAFDITKDGAQDPLGHSDVVPVAMQHILSQLHHDSRFHKQVDVAETALRPIVPPKETAAPQVKPLADFLEELKPHLLGLRRIEQFSGGFENRVQLRSSAELDALIKRMRDPRYCSDADTISMTSSSASATDGVEYTLNKKFFDQIQAAAPAAPITIVAQAFWKQWLQKCPFYCRIKEALRSAREPIGSVKRGLRR